MQANTEQIKSTKLLGIFYKVRSRIILFIAPTFSFDKIFSQGNTLNGSLRLSIIAHHKKVSQGDRVLLNPCLFDIFSINLTLLP